MLIERIHFTAISNFNQLGATPKIKIRGIMVSNIFLHTAQQ